MTALNFYNETTSNGKYIVMSANELTGKGIKNFGGSSIVEYNGELYKNNKMYSVTKEALQTINVVRTCF